MNMQFILEVPSAQFVSIYEPIAAPEFFDGTKLPSYYSLSFDHHLLPARAAELLKHKVLLSLSGDPKREGFGLIRASSRRRPLVIPLPEHWHDVEAVLADADMCHIKRDLLLRDTPLKVNCRIYEYSNLHARGHALSLEAVQVNGQAMRLRFDQLIEEARAFCDEAEEDEAVS